MQNISDANGIALKLHSSFANFTVVHSLLGRTFPYRFLASAPDGISSMVTILDGIFWAVHIAGQCIDKCFTLEYEYTPCINDRIEAELVHVAETKFKVESSFMMFWQFNY